MLNLVILRLEKNCNLKRSFFRAGKVVRSSSTIASLQSLSRENRKDGLKKGFNKLHKLADECKKKCELKHQPSSAWLRRENAPNVCKLVKEREEKKRKTALELEQKNM